ncbi:Protein of unknown function [Pyronema omphalodes CBS 100304]|uniref:Uncharacterized protein n=1 Tax=Pyronema omphalodes (strain CBS 100304) TaxID=1076935 RepID=U4LCE9_PYROM|nr:Protein of unknown function [Pyronema omphalodes CBS 100304]
MKERERERDKRQGEEKQL